MKAIKAFESFFIYIKVRNYAINSKTIKKSIEISSLCAYSKNMKWNFNVETIKFISRLLLCLRGERLRVLRKWILIMSLWEDMIMIVANNPIISLINNAHHFNTVCLY